MTRYFLDDTDYLYFHSYMSDYFLGTYGGGILKPFRYTEIQKHTFHLKSKDDNKDRQVPDSPQDKFVRLQELKEDQEPLPNQLKIMGEMTLQEHPR